MTTTSDFKPFLIAWNLTKRCNLRCDHCYLSAGERDTGTADELTTEECRRVIDGIASVNEGTILVLTGGEPMLRPDLPVLARYAANRGMMVVVGTNGMMLTESRVRGLLDAGVLGVSISIDSLDAATHDRFRGLPGALGGALRGIQACKIAGMPFQIHATASRINLDEIPSILEFAHREGARVFNLFFLVCTGRGETITDISAEDYERLLSWLVEAENRYPGMFVRARCAPHYKRIAYEKDPTRPVTRAQGYEAGGCLAGAHYARIGPDGALTPCPFMPLAVGNLRTDDFASLWNSSPVFEDLRRPRLAGKCGACEYAALCGGCRARPFASHGDYFDEDLWCLYEPKGGARIEPLEFKDLALVWSKEAEARLARLPYFLRGLIRGRVETKAMARGLTLVTLAFMEELRREMFGNSVPIFREGRFGGLEEKSEPPGRDT